MALTESDLSELLAALKAGEMTDTIRSSLEWILQQLIEAEATAAVRVNLFEAGSCGNHCVVVGSSWGLLIHTASGRFGGAGGLRTKRSGWAA